MAQIKTPLFYRYDACHLVFVVRCMKNEIYNHSEEHDSVLDNRFCECDGHLSIIAKPKCIYCDIEIFDSFFHYSEDAPNS